MIRILLVPTSDYVGHPFPQRHNQIFERLSDCTDFEVHVVRFKLFEIPRLRTKLHVHELGAKWQFGPSLYYLTGMLNHALEIKRIIRREKIDLLVLSNLSAPFCYALLDRLSSWHVPTILDLADYYPSSAATYISDISSLPGKLISATFERMMCYIIRHSCCVTAASYALAEYANNSGARRSVHIPNGISGQFLHVHDGTRIRERLQFAQDDTVVGYIGSVESWVDTRTLIVGMRLAKERGMRIKGLFIGKGIHGQTYSKRLSELVSREGLSEDVVRLDFVPYERVPEFIAATDVGTIPFDIGNLIAYYSAPNKMWEYFSQMKPVICTPIPEALMNVDSVLIASKPADYVLHIMALASGNTEISQMIRRGYAKALHNTWQRAADAFVMVAKSVLDHAQ